ncbi:NADPH-dependent F420 reductase [Streptomyces sp. NPDC018045]|uniref:NADPH-dependent F420 reductase n=1 Tax=Streptomyces sp. NPDC018045 TaxID=3365037 RepID=UPI00379E9F7D
MSTISMIGSGQAGSTLARLAVGAGHDVVLSNSRGPETLWARLGALGPRARAATAEDTAEAGDIVVVTVPLKHYRRLPAAASAGKTVIDTINYHPRRDEAVPALDAKRTTTSQLVPEHLKDSRPVKLSNNIWFHHPGLLGRPAGAADRGALPGIRPASARARRPEHGSHSSRWWPTGPRSAAAGPPEPAPARPRPVTGPLAGLGRAPGGGLFRLFERQEHGFTQLRKSAMARVDIGVCRS